MNKPIIMVSSTFYDLKQIRDEIRIFIDGLGYESLLSEFSTFPISADIRAIENCRKKVELYADILILIIGGRYGSIDDRSGKSITNLEYIEARNKGIPIYVFIESKILNYLDVWKKNRDGDFSSVVDTTEVFIFIEKIRSIDSVWTFPFDVITTIKETLTHQLAYIFKESLSDRLRLRHNGDDPIFKSISSKSLAIIIDKPKSWEYKLFFQVWIDELGFIYEKIYEYTHNLNLSESENITIENFVSWSTLRLHEIQRYVNSANKLISNRTQIAFGPDGMPGDEKEIIIVAKSLVKTFKAIIDWTIKVRLVNSEEPFYRVLNALAGFTIDIIKNMQEYPIVSLKKIEDALLVASTDNPQKVETVLEFHLSNMDEFTEAMRIASEYLDNFSLDDLDNIQ